MGDSVSDTVRADDMDVRRSVRSIQIDQFTVEAILDSYLLQTTKKDVVVADRLMTQLESDEAFARQAHRAVADGLIFSTFVGTLDDEAFVAALQELEALDDESLDAMRLEIFEYGVSVACKTVGGTPTQGKYRRRQALFKDALKAASEV